MIKLVASESAEKLKENPIGGIMKKLITVTFALIATSSHAGLFGSAMTSDWPTKNTTKYKVEAYGFDVRIYEWIPEGNTDVRCVLAAGDEISSGVACYTIK